jgi:TolB protein
MWRCAIAAAALLCGGSPGLARASDATLRGVPHIAFKGQAAVFAPGVASTTFSEVRLTISPDGRTAIWFSRNRPGGPGGYDIWISRRTSGGWSEATPAPFNSPTRDFDPAFSPDGRYVYFCSDRPGGLGGDDIYRVRVSGLGFGPAENLGPGVNSPQNEFAPMLSPDRGQLLFASNRAGGRGGYDLYVAPRQGDGFGAAAALSGDINSAADEFDATFLSDSRTIVFARAPDMQVDRVELDFGFRVDGRYVLGGPLPPNVNDSVKDTYGPMLDWSQPHRLTFSGQRDGAASMDLYTIAYSLR